jgi:hypothetical protein
MAKGKAVGAVIIEDPLIAPYVLKVLESPSGTKYIVSKPFEVKSGASKGTIIHYTQAENTSLSEVLMYLIKKTMTVEKMVQKEKDKKISSLQKYIDLYDKVLAERQTAFIQMYEKITKKL